jgi:diguanylate cyclase (GGDEF)-like protein/putative nucleotidyltransferase with HDIG domain
MTTVRHATRVRLDRHVVALASALCAIEVTCYVVAMRVIGTSGTASKVLADLVYPVLEAVACVLLAVACTHARSRRRRLFLLGMTVSTVLAFCGDMAWAVFDMLLHQAPSPSVADAFYIAGLAVLTPTLAFEFGSPLPRWRELLDVSIVFCAAVFAGMQWLIEPQIERGLTGATLVAIAESVLALVAAFTVLASLSAATRKPPLSVRLIATAIVVQGASWIAYTYVVQVQGVVDVSWFMVGWETTWSLLIVGAVASIQGGRGETASAPRTPTGANPGLLTAGLLLVLAVFALDSQSGRLDALAVTFGIAVTLLVVLRLQVALRERGRLADAMRLLATTDPLTGVPNRRAFDERVNEAVLEARRTGLSVGVLSIDADGFKLVNDGFGHPVGDEVLRQVARRLVECVRPSDMVARVGGEEFALLAEGVDPARLTELGERCRRALADEPIVVGSVLIPLTASVGGACLPDHAHGADELLRVADHALYEAKNSGRNRVHLGFADSPQRTFPIPDSAVLQRLERLADRVDGAQALQEHSMAMIDVAARLCDALGVSIAERRRCIGAARLHDIGKIGTPPFILTKPGALTRSERRVMQDHVRVGVELLESIPQTREFAHVVAQHHEWFDGRGYPDGKAGGEIRIEARIIAVADAWTAMLADRPYRRALTPGQARTELQAGAGTQFDPAVVAALLALIDGGTLAPPNARLRVA